jgi:hypothetical protein
VRSRPLTLHGAPALIAGVAADARSPVTSHTKEATVAERNVLRDELLFDMVSDYSQLYLWNSRNSTPHTMTNAPTTTKYP